MREHHIFVKRHRRKLSNLVGACVQQCHMSDATRCGTCCPVEWSFIVVPRPAYIRFLAQESSIVFVACSGECAPTPTAAEQFSE
jgi:hypothetical protein